MNEFFKIDKRILDASDKALKLCKEQFENIEKITEYNQQKVQKAFIDNRISETHFGTSTGYGYGDIGRETLDKVWAQVLGAESALVRHNFTCGTHTLATALFGVLRPGDNMLCVSGTLMIQFIMLSVSAARVWVHLKNSVLTMTKWL